MARVLVAAHIQGVMPLLRSRRLDRRPDCFATSGHACLCHSPNVSGRPLDSLLADVTWRSCLSDSPFQRIFSGSNELDRLPVIACPSLFARRRSLAPSDQPRGIACLSAFHEIHKKTREKRAVYRSLKLKQAGRVHPCGTRPLTPGARYRLREISCPTDCRGRAISWC